MDPLSLTKALIEKKSLTPDDGGCLSLIETLLTKKNFTLERLDQGNVKNLFASIGTEGPLFIFLGHVDVVPPGDEKSWRFPPFQATEDSDRLYGRGAADMKSGVAAMTCALLQFAKQNPKPPFRAGLLLTSDEEGIAIDGVKHVMEVFKSRGTKIDYCLVGEASSKKIFGDTIKIGRRGTLSGTLTIHGKQGHIAYPQLADNPIQRFAPVLTELCQLHWDEGNEHFPPTQCQFSNIHSGTGANNVIPASLTAEFNFRFSTASTEKSLREAFEACLKKHQLNYEIHWRLGGLPFLTPKGPLLQALQKSIEAHTNLTPHLSTDGGTSDGRFVAPTGAETIEFGVIGQSIHQVDEHVNLKDIQRLTDIYQAVLKNMAEILQHEK